MIYAPINIKTKYQTNCLFRSPVDEDSKDMLNFIKTLSFETDYILTYPEEINFDETTELSFLKGINQSQNQVMIVALVDGVIAGNCQIRYKDKLKNQHRALVAIGLLKAYWGLGIATTMFELMIAHAKEKGSCSSNLKCLKAIKEQFNFMKKWDLKSLQKSLMPLDIKMVILKKNFTW